MSAKKARGIHKVDVVNESVVVTGLGGVIQSIPVPWRDLSKVELIALAKQVNVKFTGRPPMHWSRAELLDAIRVHANGANMAAMTATTTPEPTVQPKVDPKPATVRMNGASLDTLVSNIVSSAVDSALAEYRSAVDPEAVQSVVAESMNGFRHEFTAMVAKIRPEVRQITVRERPTVTLSGRQHAEFDTVLAAVGAGDNVYLVGPAGTGKSTIAENVAKALGASFASKSVTAQTSEASLVGFVDAHGKTVRTPFREVFEHGGVFLLDEVDNGNPNVLNVLNSALANGVMAFPDGMVRRHDDFVAIAAANTYGNGATAEYVGRNPIDKAFTDRFSMLPIDLDEQLELHMLQAVGLDSATESQWLAAVRHARLNVACHGLRHIVSPRATVNGARLIRAGIPMAKAWEMRVVKGASADQREKITAGITF